MTTAKKGLNFWRPSIGTERQAPSARPGPTTPKARARIPRILALPEDTADAKVIRSVLVDSSSAKEAHSAIRRFVDAMKFRRSAWLNPGFATVCRAESFSRMFALARMAYSSVRYHSLKKGAAEREIIPHALVDSGLRWHTRVFDRKSNEFRDLVISRIESAEPLDGSSVGDHETAASDEQWNRTVTLGLIPHPGQERPEIVQRDFGMNGGVLTVSVRAAVAGYFLQLWHVDCSPDRSLDPSIHRLCLSDVSQIAGIKSVEIAPGYVQPSPQLP